MLLNMMTLSILAAFHHIAMFIWIRFRTSPVILENSLIDPYDFSVVKPVYFPTSSIFSRSVLWCVIMMFPRFEKDMSHENPPECHGMVMGFSPSFPPSAAPRCRGVDADVHQELRILGHLRAGHRWQQAAVVIFGWSIVVDED